ncbi:MAG: DUF948 domain-containing protein [Methanobacterium sp.]
MNMEIFLIVVGVIILLVGILSIPILTGLWRTIRDITVTLDTLNSSLPSILKNLEEITANINNSTSTINREVQEIFVTVSHFQSVINDIVNDIHSITPSIIKSPALKNAFAVYKGVSTFLKVILTKPSPEI